MKQVRTAIILAALSLPLAGCSNFYGLVAYTKGGEIWFDIPDRGWFDPDCVDVVEVAHQPTGEVFWSILSSTNGCSLDLPFRYGEYELRSGSKIVVEPQALEPGLQYELFIEVDGSAGSADFVVNEDGSVTNM